jgi:hypothetical protein
MYFAINHISSFVKIADDFPRSCVMGVETEVLVVADVHHSNIN